MDPSDRISNLQTTKEVIPESPRPSVSNLHTSKLLEDEPFILENAPVDFASFNNIMTNSEVIIAEIVAKGRCVRIDEKALEKLIKNMLAGIKERLLQPTKKGPMTIDPFRFSKDYFPKIFPKRLIPDWIFVMNALNFCLWNRCSHEQYHNWTVDDNLTGYEALCAAFKRAIVQDNRRMFDPNYYTKAGLRELKYIFRNDDTSTFTIPLIKKRMEVLRTIGRILLSKYQGTFMNCIEMCKGDPLKLRYLVFTEFPPFQDIANYKGQEVYICSKLATLISDLHFFGCIDKDINWMPTILADYRAPDVLHHLQVLNYHKRFSGILTHGSTKELQLRCCSIVAMKKCCSGLLTLLMNNEETEFLTQNLGKISILLDNYLWEYRCRMERKWENLPAKPNYTIKSIYF